MRTYLLIFRGVKLGQVKVANADTPNPTGRFTLGDATDHPEVRNRVVDYIQFRVEADRIARDTPHSLEEFLNLSEPAFADLVNSDEWCLEDERGRRLPILAPVFSAGGTITWRWRQ